MGKSVVELGGAMSNGLLAIAKWRGSEVVAVDYSPSAIEATKRMFAHNNCQVNCICSDFFKVEGKFDLVTHWGVLEHQVDPFPLIELSVKLCNPGGYVMFSMPQMRGPAAWHWRHKYPENWNHHIYHSDQSIRDSFVRLGLKCKRAFWGPPMIRITGYEPTAPADWMLSRLQFWANQIDRFSFSPYHFGMPWFSMARGFIARVS